MPRSLLLRSVFALVLLGAFLPVAFSQSLDSQSVAEAARRAREKKKDSAKPAKVITDDTLDVKKGDVQSAVAEEPKIAGAPDAAKQSANGAANPATSDPKAPAAKDEKLKKELTAAKEQLKRVLEPLFHRGGSRTRSAISTSCNAKTASTKTPIIRNRTLRATPRESRNSTTNSKR